MFYGQEYLLSKDTIVCFFLVFLCFALIYLLLFFLLPVYFCLVSFMLKAILKSLISLATCSHLGMRFQKAEWRLSVWARSTDKHLTTQKGLAALASFGSFLEIQTLWSHHKLQI